MYYPKSQIKTNLYTNGGEFKLESTNQPYIGNYYTTSNGKTFAGSSPYALNTNILLVPISTETKLPSSNSPIPPKLITPFKDIDKKNNAYNNLSKERYIPQPFKSKPTLQDYIQNTYPRYFCKKNNEILYFEIDRKTHTDLFNKSSLIAYELYTPISVNWVLTGDKEQVFSNNKANISRIQQTQKLFGFISYFKNNFTEYYLEI